MKSLIEQGAWLNFSSDEPSQAKHVFCGPNDTLGASCPNCHKPLLRFCLLNLSDIFFKNVGFRTADLPLLFCWTCNVAQDRFYYRYDKEGLGILYYKSGGQQVDFPYPSYPMEFPAKRFSLRQISEFDQQLISRINEDEVSEYDYKARPELTRPTNQIGGQPYLIQKNTDDELNCYCCKKPMLLFASIADDETHGYNFVDNPYVQVLYFFCRNCEVVGCFQQCD